MKREPYITHLLMTLGKAPDSKSNETIARWNELAELIKYPDVFRPLHQIYSTRSAKTGSRYNDHINCSLFNSLLSAYTFKHKSSILGRIVSIEEGCFHVMEITKIDLIADKQDALVEVLHI